MKILGLERKDIFNFSTTNRSLAVEVLQMRDSV